MTRTTDPSDARQVPHDGTHPPTAQPGQQPVATPDVAGQSPRPQVSTDPQLDQPQKQGVTGGTWIALILGALILVLLLIFILQNNTPADFVYLGWNFTLPLGVAMLFAAIAGMLIMALFGSVRLFKLGHRVRKLQKERKAIKHTLG